MYEEKFCPLRHAVLNRPGRLYERNLDFLRLLDAERQVNMQREMYYQAMADYHRRLAELDRAVGSSLPEATNAR